ncbi:putative RNA polymerase ECF-type sigma factor [Firmicutes bacterium CAG:240]|nr:putative RNA polymerase ECF-type sigma factor [Firmicutes bacterium CAG:240]
MQENTVERLLLEKNEQGMDALLLHYGPLMRYIIAPILQNPQDREDCLSEVSMRVWEKIGQFDGEKGSFRAWLTTITRNTALNHARRASGSSAEELSESTPSPDPTPEETLLKKERQEALKTALSRLSYKDRLLFYRKYYYRQSTAQIAAELGMTERAVEGKLYRVKKQLRKSLGGEACE